MEKILKNCNFLLILIILASCASLPVIRSGQYSSENLVKYACDTGKDIHSAQGSVWVKVNSSENSGQFPANIQVDSDHLRLEATNLLGGTQALITVDQGVYEITDFRQKEPTKQIGKKYWGGIPLKWATALFLGKIPCPESLQQFKVEQGSEGELILTNLKKSKKQTEKFIYRFKEWNHRPWPVSLKWFDEGSSNDSQVEFQFDSPEDVTGIPEKWEAHSEKGQVKVKWRSRVISRD